MILILTMMLGVAIGYIVAVLCYFLLTFTITSTVPHFVSSQGHFRDRYLVANCLIWLLSAGIGSYVTAAVSAAWFPWLPVSILAVLLILLTWMHPIEAYKQLAGLSRLSMAIFSIVGAALGYYLKFKM